MARFGAPEWMSFPAFSRPGEGGRRGGRLVPNSLPTWFKVLQVHHDFLVGVVDLKTKWPEFESCKSLRIKVPVFNPYRFKSL